MKKLRKKAVFFLRFRIYRQKKFACGGQKHPKKFSPAAGKNYIFHSLKGNISSIKMFFLLLARRRRNFLLSSSSFHDFVNGNHVFEMKFWQFSGRALFSQIHVPTKKTFFVGISEDFTRWVAISYGFGQKYKKKELGSSASGSAPIAF